MSSWFRRIPHYQLFFAGFIVLVFFSLILWEKKPWQAYTYTKSSEDLAPLTTDDFFAEPDTDGDGLSDWKEKLYGADIYQTDTDGDGTDDGDEVSAQRDPTKKGPGDELPYLQVNTLSTSTNTIEDARREFLTKFLKERSLEIQEDTFKRIVAKFNPNTYRQRYTLDGLIVTSESSAAAMKQYGNAFGVIIEKYSVHTHRQEEEILADMQAASEDKQRASAILKELQLPVISYRNFASDLSKVPVPIEFANAHLRIVNGYDLMSRGLTGMQELYTDPVNGAGGYQAYTSNKVEVTLGYAELVYLFSEKNIVFSTDEPGKYFTWIPTTIPETAQ